MAESTPHEGKRSLEDIAATQASIVERLDEHASGLAAIETAIQLLSANITNMRTELLVIKGLLNERSE